MTQIATDADAAYAKAHADYIVALATHDGATVALDATAEALLVALAARDAARDDASSEVMVTAARAALSAYRLARRVQ